MNALTRNIGARAVRAVGYGAMPLSATGRPDRATALAVLRSLPDMGVDLVDTADAYCLDLTDTGHNESLLAEALGGRTDVMVATKGGHVRDTNGGWHTDGRPQHLAAACDASLRRLGREAIDLYWFHRPDPKVPFAESVGAMADLQSAGKVRQVGVSNVTVAQLDEAAGIADVTAVQNELSLIHPECVDVLHECERRGLAFVAHTPLGGRSARRCTGDAWRAAERVAARHDVSPERVAIAWLLRLSPRCVPIPGSRRADAVADCVAAVDLELTSEDLATLTSAVMV